MTSAVDAYGESIGLAFQIVDDILDVEGASAESRQDRRQGCGCRQADLSRRSTASQNRGGWPLRASSARSTSLERAGLGGQLRGDRALDCRPAPH